ncbi:hypothetical protein EPD60_13505 [Flaviaesturariibacter flavus]|uniref:Uncharacterized protein n=1 Tax=Flaviaesturariibacter flavus TaxID=2502780 RepID=A0A4R1B9A4_9BACT|nr:hypothetical protein [Flaviaesturariibacter flavus]TCJ13399.1 hypothetical protein EPD60_13505 [Flaviaesturariibacter flavus]
MKRSSISPMGALHPLLFFVLVYGISLVMALFVCRSVYAAVNGSDSAGTSAGPGAPGTTAVAYR